MNIVRKTSLIITVLIAATSMALASPNTEGESKAVKKAKEAVEATKAYDWKTLAESAEICFKKNENIEEALEWINKSIELQQDPYNLEVKGDYYLSQGKNKEAVAYYAKAISAGKDQNFWFDSSQLQEKIWDLR